MRIELHEASIEEKPILGNLMELYLYDLSEVEGTDVAGDGRFGYPFIDNYWTEDGRHPYLIRIDGAIAGLALVRRLSDSGDEPHHEMAELFIMRKYRRRGAGRSTARRLFDTFPGMWSVQQREANTGAQEFWRRVLKEYTQGRFEELRVPTEHGRDVVQRFHSRPRA